MVKLKVVSVLGGCWFSRVSAEQSRPTDHNLRPSVGSPELLSPLLASRPPALLPARLCTVERWCWLWWWPPQPPLLVRTSCRQQQSSATAHDGRHAPFPAPPSSLPAPNSLAQQENEGSDLIKISKTSLAFQMRIGASFN